MFKTLIMAAAALATASSLVPAAAQTWPNRYGTTGNSMQLYDPLGGYHGNLNANPYDPNSISNPDGPYGSPYSPQSVTNPYATFDNGLSNNGFVHPGRR
jgi:hypothetical protein